MSEVKSEKRRVVLGLMTFGRDVEGGARITDLDTFNKALDLFQARGYNEVDTARLYVTSTQESFTREANWKERGLKLATKVHYPQYPGANSADKVLESIETSLKELGTECIDILFLHAPDRGIPFAETLRGIDQAHKAGKFVQFGISNYSAYEVAEIVMTCKYNNWVRPTIYQGMYNAITRNAESELFVACHHYGLDIVAYNPIAAGLFSGKIKSKDIVPEEGRFSNVSKIISTPTKARYFRDSTFRALQVIEAAAEKAGLTMIETALRWMVHHSGLNVTNGNDGIIIGVSSIAQLESNLNDIEKGPLPEEVVQALDEAWKISKVESVPYWHGVLQYGYKAHEVFFGTDAQ